MASENLDISYRFDGLDTGWWTDYLWAPLKRSVRDALPGGGRLFEVGCGNGVAASMLAELGYDVVGVDPSENGVKLALEKPGLAGKISIGSAYDDLASTYGRFPVVISLEVVEHCFYPRKFAKTIFDLLEPGGTAIVSTPYHGYLKNLALALFNKFDSHWGPLWDGGHIKFWSERTLLKLLAEAGFTDVKFILAGRFAPFAKSMIAVAKRPASAAA